MTMVNFRLAAAASSDHYGDRLGYWEMTMPREGDVVDLDGVRYRIERLETHRVRLLGPPWVTLVNIATVEPT